MPDIQTSWLADLETLQTCSDRLGLARAFMRVIDRWGSNGFMLLARTKSGAQDTARCLGAPESLLLKNYQEAGYWELDPILDRARREPRYFHWKLPPSQADMKPKERAYLDDAAASGFLQGVAFPFRLQGSLISLTLISLPAAEPLAQDLSGQHALCLALHSLNFFLPQQEEGQLGLTKREAECLRWAATGKTNWETAKILEISDRTVQFHLDNARKKLNAATITQAAAIGISRGLIQP